MAWVLAYLLFLAGGTLGAAAQENSRPPTGFWPAAEADIVLLSGLAGDLESETAYRQHVQAWLEWLGGLPTPPRCIRVLADSTQPSGIKTNLVAQWAPASRAEWTALCRVLQAGTNPLVAVVWGHGGDQGKFPVFHVRGPRIVPADFTSLAGRRPSQWILCFRGSGRFARELAEAGAEVFSSDEGSVRSSDPIGMGPLLEALKRPGGASLAGVAREAGRRIESWYEERSLLRMEAPTLWRGASAPEALAGTGAPGGLAPSTPSPAVPAATNAPEPLEEPELAAPNERWNGIVRAAPREYPDAGAVVLRRRIDLVLGRSPALASEYEDFIQVLTEAGKTAGDFDVAFAPPQEEFTLLEAETLLADGKLLRLQPEELREAAEPAAGDYASARRKYFSLPGVTPGAVLHVRYRTVWQTYPLPHVFLRVPVADDLPLRSLEVGVAAPADWPLHFTFVGTPVVQPEVKQGAYGSRYSWLLTQVPATASEPLQPPESQPLLLTSTWPDWATFAEWYARVCRMTDELTPEMARVAAELTRDCHDPRERVAALYRHVTGLRYVMTPLGVNSFRPHAAARVFANRFGDCKDKANLLNTLLKAVGIEANLVLVPRFLSAPESVPGLAFNHAISRVNLAEGPLWLDTTDDICRFGMLPPGDPGREALVIDGATTNLSRLPLPSAADHRFSLRTELTWSLTNDACAATWRAAATGYSDYELRRVAAALNGARPAFPILGEAWETVAGRLSLSTQEFTPAARLDQEFAWTGSGRFLGLRSAAGARTLWRAPFWLPREWNQALHPRKAPLFLNQGYPLRLEQVVEARLPAGAGALDLPPARASDQAPLRWKLEWSRAAAETVRASLHLELGPGTLSPAAAAQFAEQLGALLTALSNGASLEHAE